MITAAVVVIAILLPGMAWHWWRRHAKEQSKKRRVVLLLVAGLLGVQAFAGVPAFADDGDLNTKCAPSIDTPGSGLVGAIDSPDLDKGAVQGKDNDPNLAYGTVSYAGLTWHVLTSGCDALLPTLASPAASIDTALGNELFNVAKVIVGVTNSLHYTILANSLSTPLNNIVTLVMPVLYNGIFTPFVGLALLILAIILFQYIWRGDMAGMSKRSMLALAGLWLASAAYLMPACFNLIDQVLIKGTSQLQADIFKQSDDKNALPLMLYNNVIYQNWLRGEFGNSYSNEATQHGYDLLKDQTWTKTEALANNSKSQDDIKNATDSKQQNFVNLYNGDLKDVRGNLNGNQGGRTGNGLLAILQALAFSLFQLLAKAAILLAQTLLRMTVLFSPLIGLVAIVYHGILAKVAKAVGAVLFNVFILAVLAGAHAFALNFIFNVLRIDFVLQILLALLLTVVFFLIGKPVKRMHQMAQLSANVLGVDLPSASGNMLGRLLRGRPRREQSPQLDFWENVQNGENSEGRRPTPSSYRGYRAESSPQSVQGASQRLDRRGELPSNQPTELGNGNRRLAIGSGGNDRHNADLIVPSQVTANQNQQYENPSQRGASAARVELSFSNEKAPIVLYSPSRGLEQSRSLEPARTGRDTQT